MALLRQLQFNARSFFIGLSMGLLLVGGFSVLDHAGWLAWITPVSADTGVIRPDGDGGTNDGAEIGCVTTNLNYDCLDEVITEPTVPGTGTDYLEQGRDDEDFFTMGTLTDVQTVTAITVQVHHIDTKNNMALEVELWNAGETTQYGTTVTFSNQLSSVWDPAVFTGLSLSQSELDGLRVRLICTKPGGGGAGDCNTHAMYAEVTYDPVIELTVSTTGTQQDLEIGTTTAHVGGAFVINELVSSRNVTGITIAETGSINAQTKLDNIELWYDLDTTGGDSYNCSDESYDGDEIKFGSTDTDGFSAANGTSAFTGSVAVSTTQAMCVYVVLDVLGTALPLETVEIQITDPSTQVDGSGSPDVSPTSTVAISGTTDILGVDLRQMHYHWRLNDVETEAGASSATGGTEDTNYTDGEVSTTYRLRMEVSNEGNITSEATQYRVEYATRVTSCESATGWTDVGAGGGDWDMSDVLLTTDGADTTNIAESTGGVTDENTTFLSTNGGFRDTNSQTGNITLTSTEFVELEYAMEADAAAALGTTYCFRVTDAGTEIDNYDVYPELLLKADLFVTTEGSQLATSTIPDTDIHIGNYVIKDLSAGPQTIQSITIHASGTVDYQNDIDNIELWYDFDTTGGDNYNCSDESFNGDEVQYGSTDTDGFSAAATSTFTGTAVVSTVTTMCLYVVLDATSDVIDAETLDIYFDDPSVDITISSGDVAPTVPTHIPGVTTFVDTLINQVHYHWRNNDGNQADASSATGGLEDTAIAKMPRNTTYRLRLQVANPGGEAAPAQQYVLEWGREISTCAAISEPNWFDVDASADEFDLVTSQLIEASSTQNIATGTGGVTDGATTFITPNGGQRETTSQTGNITLTPDTFVELEYSLQATASTTDGATYCFRVTDAGTPLETYSKYAQTIIRPATDFKITRGVSTITNGNVTTALTEGSQYDLEFNDASRAFIRVTNTNLSGAGEGQYDIDQKAEEVTVYISNPSNITSGITFTRSKNKNDTRIAWEVVEYVGSVGGENEIVVRSAQVLSPGTTAVAATSSSVSGIVDDADVVPFITGQQAPINDVDFYNAMLFTSKWNASGDTFTITRGAHEGFAANVSVAVVEYVGANWTIQRSSHTYSAVGATETESITAVNSLSRTFLHTQKRVGSGLYSHANYGHEVWLSGIGTVSHYLDDNATSAGSHTSVAWVIENTQTEGQMMKVWRSNGTIANSATAPHIVTPSIGTTLEDLTIASIFTNARSNGTLATFPEPIIAARLVNSTPTTYELWRGDGFDTSRYRTEVVEWPTAVNTLVQNYYRFYVDNDALTPTDPWPAGGTDMPENAEMTALDMPIAAGDTIRLRMSLNIQSATLVSGVDAFELQYSDRPDGETCSAQSDWTPLGPSASTTAAWRGASATPADGTTLTSTLLSVSDEFGTYEENNDSAFVPNETVVGDDIEYDWNIEHNAAQDKTDYCFKMTYADGEELKDYDFYPVIRTVGYEPILIDWKWFDDENNVTPVTPLAATNTVPIDIAFGNIIKLRTTIQEISGGTGTDAKFKIQFSEYPDFSTGVFDVVASSTCAQTATTTAQLWCYDDGAGIDNAVIDDNVLASADACSAGAGDGCGTHNESKSTTTATFDQVPLSTTEYEFTLSHNGARANAVYYFRLFDVAHATSVAATTSLPSLVTEGASLVFTISGLPASTVTENIVTDVTSTDSGVAFGSIPFDTDYEAAHRLTVDTNATEGYQVLMYVDQNLTNIYGIPIPVVTGTNASPLGWGSGCSESATGCIGYHAGDDLLQGGSSRFGADDSYAAFSTMPQEVMYSSVPTNESHDMVYKIKVSEEQSPGDYNKTITYIAVPVF